MTAKIARYNGTSYGIIALVACLQRAKIITDDFNGTFGGTYPDHSENTGGITYQFFPLEGVILEIETYFKEPNPRVNSIRETVSELLELHNFTNVPLN